MAFNRKLTKASGDYLRGFASENGKHYRHERQELSHAIKHVQTIRDKHASATRVSNPNKWAHRGSIPMTVLIDWLAKNNFTIDQWACNEGGMRGKCYPESKSGVKDKFLAYFLSRDYSKLHNMHVTTKRESSQILMPGDPDAELRRIKNSNSKLD